MYWRRPCGGHGRSRLVLHAYLYNNFFFLTPYLAFFRGALTGTTKNCRPPAWESLLAYEKSLYN